MKGGGGVRERERERIVNINNQYQYLSVCIKNIQGNVYICTASTRTLYNVK